MAYTNAIFYLDPESGNDAARTALTSVAVANNGSGAVRCTKAAHGLVTGAVVDLTLNYVGAWKITVIDANTFDLIGSAYSTATACTVTPRGGSSKADAWKTVNTGVSSFRVQAGDTVRIKASPDPSSLGQSATWTDGPQQSAKTIASSTNASPIVLSLSSANYTALAPAVGDTVIVNGHTVNTNANGVWTISAVNGSTSITLQDAAGNNSVGNGVGTATGNVRKATNMVVKLTTAVTKNIALCGNQGQKPNWTAANANITPTVIQTDFKEGGECQKIDVLLAFTTGLAAYFPTGTLDLSGYQQVAFWIKQTAGTIGAAGALSLKLCTDVAGATPVHSIDVPNLANLAQWTQVVVDLGTNLNTAIKSVALYVNTDNGAQTFQIDHIIACKAAASADALTLASIISKNTGTEAWWGIQSINGTRVMLDGYPSAFPGGSPQRGYAGVTETVALYKREAFKPPILVSGTNFMLPPISGTASAYLNFLGGWNRTDMSTQTGESWFDGQGGNGAGFTDGGAARSYIYVDKLNYARFATGFNNSSGSSFNQRIGSLAVCNCGSTSVNINAWQTTADTLCAVAGNGGIVIGGMCAIGTVTRADGCLATGVTLGSGSTLDTVIQASNNGSNGVSLGSMTYTGSILGANGNLSGVVTGDDCVVGYINASYNSIAGVSLQGSSGARVLGGTTANNQAGVSATTSGKNCVRNFYATETQAYVANNTGSNSQIFSECVNGVADTHIITTDGGTISSATDQRNTASGISWKFRPTSTNRSSIYPLSLSVAKIAVTANTALTVQISTRRDSTNIKGRLRIKGKQLLGISNDVSVACEPAINTWVLSDALTVTPTETGVVEVVFDVWDGVNTTNNYWIDDLVIT